MMKRRNLFVPNKRDYVRGKRPQVDCILCSILKGEPEVVELLVHLTDLFGVTVNLYPYNAGHLMIFPIRHIIDPREYNAQEILELHELQKLTLDILQTVYEPMGFNIGYNIGRTSGQSIPHVHLHVVPRYPNEVGFMDIIGGTKIVVEDPVDSKNKLKKAFTEATKKRTK